jgi:ferredoxin
LPRPCSRAGCARRIGATYRLRLSSGRTITAPVGRSILEALRDEGIPHASVCGGRARCTTCRVRVGEGLAQLGLPSNLERMALMRIDAPPNVRLACQTRPRHNVSVAPLLPPGADPRSRAARARRRDASARSWRCSSTCAGRPSFANRACPTTRCSS